MKIKFTIICLFLFTTQAFAEVSEKCIGTDVSKWDNCFGEKSTSNGSADLEEWVTSKWSRGPYKKGKKNGFFKEGLWVRRHDISSDGYEETGNYINGVRQGLWGYCYLRQVSYTYFQIGNYNEWGVRDGPWGQFNTYDTDFVDKDGNYSSFFTSGCHVETALLYLNKEEPCSNKKSPSGGPNYFTNIDVYEDGYIVGSGGVCNHPLNETTVEYKNTSMFKEWVNVLKTGLMFKEWVNILVNYEN